jgi:hypothetical protein
MEGLVGALAVPEASPIDDDTVSSEVSETARLASMAFDAVSRCCGCIRK